MFVGSFDGGRPVRRAVAIVAVLLALHVLGGLAAPNAHARPADGGLSDYTELIDWMEWQKHDDGTVVWKAQSQHVVAGRTVTTACELTGQYADDLGVYVPGHREYDAFDELFHVGGRRGANTLAVGLFKGKWPHSRVDTFDLGCTRDVDGVPVDVPGLVFADAEQSERQTDRSPHLVEYFEVSVDGPPPAWWVIDRYRPDGCAFSARAEVTGADTRFDTNAVDDNCVRGPIAVAVAEGVAAAELRVSGFTAIAVGVPLAVDHSSAPGYAPAAALSTFEYVGDPLPGGVSLLSGEAPGEPDFFELATMRPGALRLGASGMHDDAVTPGATLRPRPLEPFMLEVPCTGPGFVAGWLDWDRDGTFEADEGSAPVECVGPTADLTWTVPDDVVVSTGAELTYLRLRIGPDEASVSSPTGLTAAGEVEDHAVEVRPRSVRARTVVDPAPGEQVHAGQVVAYTLEFENLGTAPADVDFTHYLDGVLDDGDLAAGPTGSGGLAVSALTGSTFAVTGTLPGGQTATVTYTVTVKPESEWGDGLLLTATAEGADAPPDPCAAGDPLCSNLALVPLPPTSPPSGPGSSGGSADPPGGLPGAAGAPARHITHGSGVSVSSGAWSPSLTALPATGAPGVPAGGLGVLLLTVGSLLITSARRSRRTGGALIRAGDPSG